MRLDGVTVENFRGLRRADIHGLSGEALVTVSGPNGSGKSLLFEAITLLWRSRRGLPGPVVRVVGDWGETGYVSMELALTEPERALATRVASEHGLGLPGDAPERIVLAATLEQTSVRVQIDDRWADQIWSGALRSALPFAEIDYLPADRTIPRGEQANVNPSLLAEAQREQFRQQIVGSFIQHRQVVSLSGVAPILASLDYLDMLAGRAGDEPTRDFDRITGAFYEATGKRINRPTLDPGSPYGASLMVETESGTSHTIDQLSSGEQEVLGLMYYVRRLSARGGILIIDEPELHLHPALQRSLFAVLENVAERAQVWIATHSPRLVTAANLDAVLHMTPPSTEARNQIERASDEEARLRLLDELGVHPIEVLQTDALIIVEGNSDANRISALFPLESGRATVHVAGSAAAVEATCRTLAEQSPLPFLGVRDRDLLSDEEVARLERNLPNLFVWPSRSFENELLHTPLLVRTLRRAGRDVSESEVRERVRVIADGHRAEVLAALVDAELRRRHAYERRGGDPLDRLRHQLIEVQRVAQEKAYELDSVAAAINAHLEERWSRDHPRLLDGKRALAEFKKETPFHSDTDLVNALLLTAREEPEVAPLSVKGLRIRLLGLY